MKIRFAQIEPTTRCNFTCGFCAGRHMAQQNLPLATFQCFIDQVEGLEHIELQGEGEPLLHPDFFAMVALARARFPQVQVSMISNGSLFTERNVARLLEHGIRKIFVSVESVDDERFQAIRGGKLDRVRRGIRRLLGARDARGMTTPTVGLAVTVLRSTAAEVSTAIPRFYRALGLDGGISVQPLQAMRQYARWYSEAVAAEQLRPADGRRVNAAMGGSATVQSLLRERHREPGFYERLYASVDKRLYCPWLVHGAYLATDGNLMPCCHVKDYGQFSLGAIGITDAGTRALAGRAELQRQLSSAEVPAACEGCALANDIVRTRLRMGALAPSLPKADEAVSARPGSQAPPSSMDA